MASSFWPAALSSLPQDSYALKLLKIHYLSKLQKVDSGRKSEVTRCTKCNNLWSAGEYSIKVIPIVARNHKKNARRLAKLEAAGVKGGRKQEWIKRKLQESTNHGMVLTCSICQKKTKLTMKKPKKALTVVPPVEKVVEPKANKKRKKDKFAGLNADVLNRHKTHQPTSKPSPTPKPAKDKSKESTNTPAKNSMLDLVKSLKSKNTKSLTSK